MQTWTYQSAIPHAACHFLSIWLNGLMQHRNSLGYVIGSHGRAMIVWGHDAREGRKIFIDEADRGGGQGLLCECGSPLVAKKGDIKEAHFAHASGHGVSCEAATNAAALNFITTILLERRSLRIPPVLGRVGHAEIFSIAEQCFEEHPVHVINAQKGQSLRIVTRIKRKTMDQFADADRLKGISTIHIDLFEYRNEDDAEIADALMRGARREWLYYAKPLNRSLLNPRQARAPNIIDREEIARITKALGFD